MIKMTKIKHRDLINKKNLKINQMILLPMLKKKNKDNKVYKEQKMKLINFKRELICKVINKKSQHKMMLFSYDSNCFLIML